MTTKEQEMQALSDEFSEHEAGVAEALELYLRIEEVYVKASEAGVDTDVAYTSDSTNPG